MLELELEDKLRAHFPEDEIQPVAKGVRGGDVFQRVTTPNGPCVILWEFKNTKNWTEGWISKLKQDQREGKADMAVLVTRALPKEIAAFGLREGVWVTDFVSAIGLACVLRESLVQISYARTAAEGMSYKMELIYKYLAGPEFKQRVEAIVEKLSEMQKDLNDEMRAHRQAVGEAAGANLRHADSQPSPFTASCTPSSATRSRKFRCCPPRLKRVANP